MRDDERVVFRVPRDNFDEALPRIDKIGDVVHRDVRAEDVGDRYRELEVRIATRARSAIGSPSSWPGQRRSRTCNRW